MPEMESAAAFGSSERAEAVLKRNRNSGAVAGARRAWPAALTLPSQVFRMRIRESAMEGTASASSRGAGFRTRSVLQ
jgi:hypothetical protein